MKFACNMGFRYGGLNSVTAIFVTWPEVTTPNNERISGITITFESLDVRSSYFHIRGISS